VNADKNRSKHLIFRLHRRVYKGPLNQAVRELFRMAKKRGRYPEEKTKMHVKIRGKSFKLTLFLPEEVVRKIFPQMRHDGPCMPDVVARWLGTAVTKLQRQERQPRTPRKSTR
jgi:hypothetical protein